MKQYTTGHDDSGSRSEEHLSSVDRPSLVVIDNLELSTRLDPYLSLRALATYSGCSIRWLRDRLVDSVHPLPCYRVEGQILVRRSDFDEWMAWYRNQGRSDVERLVAPVLREFRGR